MSRWKELFIESVMDELYSIGYDYIGSNSDDFGTVYYNTQTIAEAVKQALGEEDGTEEVSYRASVNGEAKWSYRDDYGNPVPCHCTNCGCRAHTETGNAGCQTIEEDILSKFCPNCGARMTKEEDING